MQKRSLTNTPKPQSTVPGFKRTARKGVIRQLRNSRHPWGGGTSNTTTNINITVQGLSSPENDKSQVAPPKVERRDRSWWSSKWICIAVICWLVVMVCMSHADAAIYLRFSELCDLTAEFCENLLAKIP